LTKGRTGSTKVRVGKRGQARMAAFGGLPALPGSPGLWRWLAVGACFLVTLGLLYPEAMFEGLVFSSADAANAHAVRVVGDRSLAAGEYPLWNPYLFAGMPSFGSLAYVRFLYPPSLILGPLHENLGFPPLTWLLAHLFFGALGMAWLLSRWRLSLAVLIAGGVLWLMLPKVVAWGVHGHGSKLGAAMYLPWLVGWVLQVLDGRGARAVGMVGLLLGLQLLRGHVQITYYTLLLVGWLALWNAVQPLDETLARAVAGVRWRRFMLVLGGLALGFAIGALLLVPAQEYARISIRGQDVAGGGGVGLDYATGWSLAPSELGTFVLPVAAGFGKATYQGLMPFTDYPNYLGILLLMLAMAGWWRGSRGLTLSLGVMSMLAIVVSFGNHGFGFYEFLYRFLPFFNKFRVPSMVLILVGFTAVVLAARGLEAWRDGQVPWGRPRLLPVILGVMGLAVLLAGATGLVRGGYQDHLRSLATAAGRPVADVLLDEAWLLHRASLVRIGLVLMVAASGLWFSLRHEGFRRQGLVWLLLGLMAMDLGQVDRLVIHPEKGLLTVANDGAGGARLVPARNLIGRLPLVEPEAAVSPADRALQEAVGHQRIWPLGNLGTVNDWMELGIRSVGGYHPAKLAGYEQVRRRLYDREPAGHLANWLGVSHVVFGSRFGDPEFAFLAGAGLILDRSPRGGAGTYYYHNQGALPRARWATAWRPVSETPGGGEIGTFLDALQAAGTAGRPVTLDAVPDPAPRAATAPMPVPGFLRDGMNEVVLTTDLDQPAVLVLADMMAPGWQVFIDGKPRPILTADLLLRAVAVPAGNHEVRFVYRDRAVRRGLILTVAGTLLALLLILSPFLRRLRPAPNPGAEA